jgi:hypothetical protein
VFPFARLIRQDACATSTSQVSIESSTESRLFGSADSFRFEFGEMLAIKKLSLFNVATQTLQEVSERYLDRRITDVSTRQGSFLYV